MSCANQLPERPVTLIRKTRTSLPIQTSLRRVPLRTKLVASVLALVFAALTLISAASTYALHTYMIGRLDVQLAQLAGTVENLRANEELKLPGEYLVALTSVDGVGTPKYDTSLKPSQLPPLAKGVEEVTRHAITRIRLRPTPGEDGGTGGGSVKSA